GVVYCAVRCCEYQRRTHATDDSAGFLRDSQSRKRYHRTAVDLTSSAWPVGCLHCPCPGRGWSDHNTRSTHWCTQSVDRRSAVGSWSGRQTRDRWTTREGLG